VAILTQHSGSRDELDSGATVKIEGKEYPDYVAIGVAYAELIADEKIPACRLLILAAQRFLRMYAEAKKGNGDIYWSDEHAIEPCAFIETQVHVKGVLAKTPIRLEAWQIWVIIAIYGFRWSDTGDRVVTDAILEITRKQGKSLLAAGLSLYELGPNAHIGDDLYIIAPTAALAQKVLEPMSKMVEYNPPLKEHYGIRCLTERIDVAETESYATILSSSGKKQDGHDPKVVVADEFHSLPAAIYNVMKSSQGARPESLFLKIGSAGYNAFGVGWDERNIAIEVLEGEPEFRHLDTEAEGAPGSRGDLHQSAKQERDAADAVQCLGPW
jgi:phage terminase large subunit-like protein